MHDFNIKIKIFIACVSFKYLQRGQVEKKKINGLLPSGSATRLSSAFILLKSSMDSLGEVIYDKLIIFSDGKKLGGIIT